MLSFFKISKYDYSNSKIFDWRARKLAKYTSANGLNLTMFCELILCLGKAWIYILFK